jgi:hypothetical protein
MTLTGLIFWGVIALIVLPSLIGILRNRFGSKNRFYGNEAKRNKIYEASERRALYERRTISLWYVS